MKSFCVIGLGKFGQSLAETLAAAGSQVMIIDTDADKITALADVVTNAVIGDPTNENVLRSAGITDYDCAIVCLTTNINANILLTIMLKELGVKKVVARAMNEGHRKVLERIGADMIVFPEQDMGEKLGYMLTKNNITDFVEFADYKIVELSVPESWIGKSLLELDLRRRYHVNVIAVSRADGSVDVSPSPDKAFTKGDRVSVIGSDSDIDKTVAQLK
ncbi:MAG: TrkA family potassium uptake protein [Eubacteriales bacterium]|nr:TrkA family potassium uptake protein [Eubacteriales bacterium]MDY4898310.1 TrkA family potassium uptake protein [Eubacteriales bacterium]